MRLFLKNSVKFTAEERYKLLFSKKIIIDLHNDPLGKELDNSLTAKKILEN